MMDQILGPVDGCLTGDPMAPRPQGLINAFDIERGLAMSKIGPVSDYETISDEELDLIIADLSGYVHESRGLHVCKELRHRRAEERRANAILQMQDRPVITTIEASSPEIPPPGGSFTFRNGGLWCDAAVFETLKSDVSLNIEAKPEPQATPANYNPFDPAAKKTARDDLP